MRLRYWIRSGFQTFGLVLLASTIYSFLMFIQLDDGLEGVLITWPIYLLVFGGMMLLAMNIGIYKLNLQLALSFGSTRNEAILGLNLVRLIPTVLLTAILTLLCSLTDAADTLTVGQAIPVGLGVYLFCGAIGSVIGVVYTKFGKIATVISVVVFLLVGLSAGVLAALSGESSLLATITLRGNLHWLVLCIGLFVYSLCSIPEQRTVWKCNVKL